MNYLKLKEVSKAKHRILQQYFYPWAKILGSTYKQLFYVDCFAGEGKYEKGELGSPLIIFKNARELTGNSPFHIYLIFVEKNKSRAEQLKRYLGREQSNSKLSYRVFSEDSHYFIEELLNIIPYGNPVFFFIDPYGYPISIPIINKILERKRSEVFLNLMWYQINKDLTNPKLVDRLNQMFGHSEWANNLF